LIAPREINAGTTYGVDHSASNHFGLGSSYRSPSERTQDAQGASASKPTIPLFLIAGAILAAVVLL
jgi:hypothetical protein